ncbi:MAG: hypothetical protein ACPG8W_20870 [Candidatus Promineifilaceae bacterium]
MSTFLRAIAVAAVAVVLVLISVVLIDTLLLPRLPETVQAWWIYLGVSAVIIIGVLGSIGSITGYSLRDFLTPNKDHFALKIALDYFPETGRGTAFQVAIANMGPATATINEIVLFLDNGQTIEFSELWTKDINLLSMRLPKKLEQSDEKQFLLPFYNIVHHSKADFTSPMQVSAVAVIDSYGNEHKFPNESRKQSTEFKKLKEQIDASWSEIDWITNPRQNG